MIDLGHFRRLLRARHLVFIDEASRTVLDLLARIAPSDAAVLITGETGTGKELAARHIHEMSGRSGPFVAVNCGAINEHLAESELFGHEAGSFTGATARREGWFEAADGGTLFLDEIGDLPLPLQGKLLRVLQEGEVSRVGSRRSTPVNVRIVSATNVDLTAAVAAGNFRQDLFYRLHIVPVRLPPLRERPNDIDALAQYFILHYSERLMRPPPALHRDALAALRGHSWPGNIRQLENVIHVSLLVNSENEIRVEHLSLPTASRVEPGGTVMRQEVGPNRRTAGCVAQCNPNAVEASRPADRFGRSRRWRGRRCARNESLLRGEPAPEAGPGAHATLNTRHSRIAPAS